MYQGGISVFVLGTDWRGVSIYIGKIMDRRKFLKSISVLPVIPSTFILIGEEIPLGENPCEELPEIFDLGGEWSADFLDWKDEPIVSNFHMNGVRPSNGTNTELHCFFNDFPPDTERKTIEKINIRYMGKVVKVFENIHICISRADNFSLSFDVV